MSEQNPEDDAELRESETVTEPVDIYADPPEFDNAPWAYADIPAPQDDEAEDSGG